MTMKFHYLTATLKPGALPVGSVPPAEIALHLLDVMESVEKVQVYPHQKFFYLWVFFPSHLKVAPIN